MYGHDYCFIVVNEVLKVGILLEPFVLNKCVTIVNVVAQVVYHF